VAYRRARVRERVQKADRLDGHPPPRSCRQIALRRLNEHEAALASRLAAAPRSDVALIITDIHVDAWSDEIYLGSRRLELDCTQRLRLTDLNYTFLTKFPNPECAGKPGHLETYPSDTGVDVLAKDYSGFQETIVYSVAPINLIGTGYMHHSEFEQAPSVPGTPGEGGCAGTSCL
jgi:hypothetical protein